MDSDDHQEKIRGGWRSAIFIIFVEMAERFAYYGVAGNLIMYLTTVLEQPVAEAAKNVNSWNGVSSLALLVGAFLADSYLGRFKTTLLSTLIFLTGLVLLTISTSPNIPHSIRTHFFFAALYITAIGDGGHKPCVQTFAADQFSDDTPEERAVKSSFFNWWFLGIVVGATTSILVVVYIEDNISWTIGFSIPTVVVAVAILIFVVGARTYRKERLVGSPFTRVAQVVVAAVKKRRVSETRGGRRFWWEDDVVDGFRLGRTSQFRFLEKAMIIDEQDTSKKQRDPWRLCSVNQVEQVKLIFRLLPIWACTFAYAIIVAQVHTFFIKQASTMDRSLGARFKIPPASLQVIPGLTMLIFVPFYDKFIVPALKKSTGITSGITSLHRIGLGLVLSLLTIVIAALVETRRVGVAARVGIIDQPKTVVPMTVWWLAPQFVVMGLSDMFAYVGMQELFYDQMPEDMRSMGSALTNGALGVGAFLSTAIITVVQRISSKWGDPWLVSNLNRAHLGSFYWVLVGLCTLNFIVYALLAKGFVWKKIEEEDEINMET